VTKSDPPASSIPPHNSSPISGLQPRNYWRFGITLALVPLGMKAFGDEYGYIPLLSDIDLAIHEFGHMLFMPFGIPVLGDTMVILGGSLTQVMLPLIFVSYFLWGRKEHRDPHAAMVCLWWSAINMLSVSIYAADARARELMLISGATGQEDDGHDWYNLFSRWGVLSRDHVYAGHMRRTAWLMFGVSVVLGLVAAVRQGAGRQAVGEQESNPDLIS
jgi:hypothetical protein